MNHAPACAAIVMLTILATVGCGRSATAPPPKVTAGGATVSSRPAPLCAGASAAATLRVSAGSETIQVEILGTGAVTVILSNASDQDLCSWFPYAQTLVNKGFRVALWNYGGTSALDELAAIIPAVHAGSGNVVLMGASKGAKTSLVTAKHLDAPYVLAVVCLSAEATLQPDVDVASTAAGLAVPTLLVTAANDPYGSAEALDPIRRGLADARVLRVPGAEHGTALLNDTAVFDGVLTFLMNTRTMTR